MLLLKLIKRNILIYTRDKSAIFFSLLSMFIVIGLMVVFLGKMNADEVVDLLKQYGGVRNAAADRENAQQLVMLWTLAGIVVVNAVMITMVMVGIMVDDEANKRLLSFYVSPVSRTMFVMGYIIAAVIMGVIMCLLTLAVGETYFAILGYDLLTLGQLGKTLLIIILNVFVSAGMVFLILNFVHTQSALSGITTVIGTLVGFVACIYLPIGMLPNKVQTAVKCFPMIHGSSFLREIFTEQIITKTFQNCPKELITDYRKYMGMTITYQKDVISDGIKVVFLTICGIIFIGVSAILQKRRNVMSR